MNQLKDTIRKYLPKKLWQILVLGAAGLFTAGVIVMTFIAVLLLPTLPAIDEVVEPKLRVPMRVYTAEGTLIAEFGDEKRIPVKTDKVPQHLINAILAAEDDGFYSHHGVDFLGLARAALSNLRSGKRGQGASTITMQVARNFFLSPERTYTRKFKEILLAFKIERELSKDEILELYLNKIFLGHRAYGFAAASQVYYGKTLGELTLPQYAMLAGLPKAPSKLNPITGPKEARDRRSYVLRRMHTLKFIDDETLKAANEAPVTARKHAVKYDVDAPYVAEMVRQYVIGKYADKAYGGGLHIYTTIKGSYQIAATKALRDGLLEYERRHGYRGPVAKVRLKKDADGEQIDVALRGYHTIGNLVPAIVLEVKDKTATAYTQDGESIEIDWQGLSWARRYVNENNVGRAPKQASHILRRGYVIYVEPLDEGKWRLTQAPKVTGALISLRPDDGAVMALAGGFDFYQNKFNHAVQAHRQPGSNIKPFIYSSALEKGYTAASKVSGAPVVIATESLDGDWRPGNYNKKWPGPTRLRKALKLSMNLVSVRLLRSVGIAHALIYLQRFGFDINNLPRNLSLALGTASLTPKEVARGFAVFANGGYLVEPYLILRIEDADHNIIETANPTIVCRTCPGTYQIDKAILKRGKEAQKKDEPKTEDKDKEKTDKQPAKIEPIVVKKEDEKQKQGPRYAPRVITPANAYIMTSIMKDVIRSGTAAKAGVLKRSDLAGKTGTTNDFRDAWFSGFNMALATTVWVGFDDPKPLGSGEAGSRAALPIWINYIETIKKELPEKELKIQIGVVRALINKETGKPTTEDDPEGMWEYFVSGTVPNKDDATTPDIAGDGTKSGDGDGDGASKTDGDKTKDDDNKPKKATDIF